MGLEVGDKIKLKPYYQVLKMYKRGNLNKIGRGYASNGMHIYGIEWDKYIELCGQMGQIVEINSDDYVVCFEDDETEWDVPLILIQNNKHSIKLPNNLFEL